MDINKTSYLTDLNPSVFLTTGGLKPVPAVTGRQHMTGVKKRQTTMFTHTKIPINYVIGLGKKPQFPVENHTVTKRSCKLLVVLN